MRIKILALVFMLSFYFANCTIGLATNNKASKGIISLTDSCFYGNNQILLNGQWIFFPDTIIKPSKINDALKTLNYKFISVPSKRSETKNHACGTYYLVIQNNYTNKKMVINTLTIYSSAQLFVNTIPVGNVGCINIIPQQSKPGLIFKAKPFQLYTGANHLVIQYANYQREKNGIANNIYITTPQIKLKRSVIQIIKFAIILGALIFIIINQINYFFTRRKENISLLFAMASFFIMLYIIFMSLYYFGDILPNYNPRFRLTLTSWRLVYYCAVCSFAIYIYKLFAPVYYKPILYFTIFYCSFSAVLTLFFPIHIASCNFNGFMFYTIFIGVYLSAIGVVALFKKIEDAGLFTLGFGFFIATVINDILHNLLIIHSINLLDVGIFGMMLTQAQIINKKLSRSIFNTEKLSVHLKYINNNLEEIVKRRTDEIEEQKSEIEAQRDEILAQKDFVDNQNKLILNQTKTITESINYAKEIQLAVLPEEQHLKDFFADSFILFKPKDFVSGDFYWIRNVELNNDPHLIFCVADCTGHGVPGALLSMLGITMLNEITNIPTLKTSAEILELLRLRFKETLTKQLNRQAASDGMHITLCMINKRTLEASYSGAFQSLYHIRNQELTRYTGAHCIIGNYLNEKEFTETKFTLEKNDRLYLFTDGFTDQMSGRGDGRFMQKKLLNLLLSYNDIPFKEQRIKLIEEFNAWKDGFEQIDDVLVMGLKI